MADPRATTAASIPTRTQNVKTSAAVGDPDSCSTKREVRAPARAAVIQGEPVARERFAKRHNAQAIASHMLIHAANPSSLCSTRR